MDSTLNTVQYFLTLGPVFIFGYQPLLLKLFENDEPFGRFADLFASLCRLHSRSRYSRLFFLYYG